ncbi:hypothetical protein AaE_014117 [Aphanomyces astaci]|uniref:Tc3 transposase DNA binding domain-containing protein n=1 Tax=Aphanomyces astaci TaxID=112090 RepID=A0A6A4Z7E3_APHAT|nr:hypothetical protein AaE_014117 [Aphanomyces astaci]
MGRGPQLNEFQRGQIVVWKANGETVIFMSKSLGISRTAISNYLKDPDNYGKRFGDGRKSKLTVNDSRHIFRAASKPGASSKLIIQDLQLPVSSRYVRYMLQASIRFEYVKRNATPKLTDDYIRARLAHAKKHFESPQLVNHDMVG